MKTKEKIKFKTGQTYEGCGSHGYNNVIITKVTNKTVTFTHNMGTNRAKILDINNTCDSFRYKAWIFHAEPY